MYKERSSPSLLQIVFIAALIILVIVFLIIAMNTGDLLWFWPVFEEQPQRITVHCYGDDVVVESWSSAYAPLNFEVNQSLSGSKRWDPLSMSDVTYEEYQNNSTMMVLEMTYDPPVRIHSFYKFYKRLDSIIIPLEGRHAAYNSVFGRFRGNTLAGSLHVETIDNLVAALGEQGLCQKP